MSTRDSWGQFQISGSAQSSPVRVPDAGGNKNPKKRKWWIYLLVLLLPSMMFAGGIFVIISSVAVQIMQHQPANSQSQQIDQAIASAHGDTAWLADAEAAGQQYQVPWSVLLGIEYSATNFGMQSPYSATPEQAPDSPPIKSSDPKSGVGGVLLSQQAAAGTDAQDITTALSVLGPALNQDAHQVFGDAGISYADAVQNPDTQINEPLWQEVLSDLGTKSNDTLAIGPCQAEASWSGQPSSLQVQYAYQCGTPPPKPPPTCTTTTKNKKTVTTCTPYQGTLGAAPDISWSDIAANTIGEGAILAGDQNYLSMTGTGCALLTGTGGGGTTGAPTGTQAQNAATIIGVGKTLGIPQQGWIIAIATALQESGLMNLNYGDRDSVGLFQQRPSTGWGTVAQIETPALAAAAFYGAKPQGMTNNTGLLEIPGWQSMPVTVAAQAVQASGYPSAYAKWTNEATQLASSGVNDAAVAIPLPPQVTYQSAGSGATTSGGGAGGTTTTSAASSCGGYTGATGTAADVINAAMKYVGMPYSWGGGGIVRRAVPNGPEVGPPGPGYGIGVGTNTLGFDCSGLVQYAMYVGAGISLPRTSGAQYAATESHSVPFSQLQPGDLVFWDGPSPGHVAIYIGGGKVLQAPQTGQNIDVINIWSQGFVGATQVIPPSAAPSGSSTTTPPTT